MRRAEPRKWSARSGTSSTRLRAGRISENLDALRRDYKQNLETLQDLEQERVGELRGEHRAIQRALARKEDHFGQEFGELDRAEVETEAERDGVGGAAAAAEEKLETARTNASNARADAEGAEERVPSRETQARCGDQAGRLC